MTDTEGGTNSQGRRTYVLVNNRSEGNAPLTVRALSEFCSAREESPG